MADFNTIRTAALSQGTLYEDKDFDATLKSLGNVPNCDSVKWLRPAEISNGAVCKFVVDDIKQFDVSAGPIGCGSLANALAVLCQYRGLFYRIVPADQGFGSEYKYAGVFHFRLWWAGEWVEVLVDDRLPCGANERPAALHHAAMAQWWPALIEKAYAKLHGSYESLRQATVGEILCELTGGLVETVHPPVAGAADQLGNVLHEVVGHTVLPVLVAGKSSDASQLGMTEGACYSLLAVDVVPLTGGGRTSLLRLRQSPGMNTVPITSGAWTQLQAAGWQSTTLEGTDMWHVLTDAQAQGAFWVSASDACRVFTSAHLVHFDADTCQSEVRLRDRRPLHTRAAQAHWRRGCTAGGCRNNTGTFHINPQMAISTGKDDADVLVALCQQQGNRPLVVGFSVYRMPSDLSGSGTRMDNKFFRTNKAIFHSTYTNLRQVAQRVHFDKMGQYILVASTFDAGEEGSFSVKLYSTSPISMGLLDIATAMTKSPIMKADQPLEKYTEIFAKFADDYVKSCTSLDVCRRFVQVYQCANSTASRINCNQFNDLLFSLKVWHEIFGHYAKNTSGVLKAERLRDALHDLGIRLSTEAATLATQRYMRRDGTLRFGDFAACVLHLTASFNTFQKKDAAKAGQIKLSGAEWIKSVFKC